MEQGQKTVLPDNYPAKTSIWQYAKHLGRTREEQIEKNQAAIQLIRSWREEKLDEKELEQRENNWELAKKIVDENRSRKLFDRE